MRALRLTTTLAALAGLFACLPSAFGEQNSAANKPLAVNKAAVTAPTKPTWQELTPEQRHALEPLVQIWPNLREPHKRKWLALSRNFAQHTSEEKATLQGRMKEWAALTPQQRTFARLNFADVQKLSIDERRAKWEAYQALTQQDKQKLAQKQPKPLVGVAPAIKPTPEQNRVLSPAANGTSSKPLPRINTAHVAPATLLPATSSVSPGASGASTPGVEPSSADNSTLSQ